MTDEDFEWLDEMAKVMWWECIRSRFNIISHNKLEAIQGLSVRLE